MTEKGGKASSLYCDAVSIGVPSAVCGIPCRIYYIRAGERAKRKATQENLEHVRLGEEDLSNTLHFKYLGVVQSEDGDPLVSVEHRIIIACSRFRDLKKKGAY